jgi:type IV pilus assembly protein PilC
MTKYQWTTGFLEQLAFLLTAHIHISQALEIAASFERHKKRKMMLSSIATAVAQGSTVSTALEQHPRYFSQQVRLFLDLGESTSTLAEVCQHMVASRRQQSNLISAVRNACFYPAIVLLVVCGVLLFMFWYIVPRLTQLFASLQGALPLSTRMLLFTQYIITHYWIVIGATLICLVSVGWYLLTRVRSVQLWCTNILLRMPYLAALLQLFAARTLCDTLSLSVGHGMTIGQTISLLKDSSRLHVYREWYDHTSHTVNRGENLSIALQQTHLFYSDSYQLVAVAERSGQFPEICQHARARYDHLLYERLTVLSRLVEPLLMVTIGLIVGALVISLVAPLYSITSYVTPT